MPPDEPNKFSLGDEEDKAPAPRPPARASDRGVPDFRDAKGRARKPSPLKKAILIVLIANAIPAAALVFWFTMPVEKRQQIVDAIPPGVGGRSIIAGVAFVVLIVLARLVLPAARTAGHALAGVLAWFRTKSKAARVALYVPEFFVYVSWVGMQILFALDAVAILATAAAFLLYVARIIKPELFPWLPPK